MGSLWGWRFGSHAREMGIEDNFPPWRDGHYGDGEPGPAMGMGLGTTLGTPWGDGPHRVLTGLRR